MRLDNLRRNIETEYKCLVTKKQYEKICDFYRDRAQLRRQKNVYYVDVKKQLIELNAVLRNRIYDEGNTLTFKIRIEDKLHEFEKDDCLLNDREFLAVLADYRIYPPFIELGELITTRRLVELPDAELCLDENRYNGKTDYEIEYELKNEKTNLDDFIALLKEVGIRYRPNSLSKYQRTVRSL